MKLTTYFRSTAAYRVRIALNLKGIDHELVPVNLLSGEHKNPAFALHNPDGLIPTLEIDQRILVQSIAILEYLEETHPQPALLPEGPLDRAYVRGLAQVVASDMHPLNNLRVYQYLMSDMGVSEQGKLTWYHHWLAQGFRGLELRLASSSNTGQCCFGDVPSMADICLIPQVYNANRFEFPLDDYPTIQRINEHCLNLPAFSQARPEQQPDANPS